MERLDDLMQKIDKFNKDRDWDQFHTPVNLAKSILIEANEYDIKYIYAYMKVGDVSKHFDEIENKTLGQMIRKLKELDNSDDKPLISSKDYNFLTQICDNRNHWAHSVFTEFIYIKNFDLSREYRKQCDKLEKDHDRVQVASDILEKIRIEYCKSVRK